MPSDLYKEIGAAIFEHTVTTGEEPTVLTINPRAYRQLLNTCLYNPNEPPPKTFMGIKIREVRWLKDEFRLLA
jgi:hypothetical protein